MSLHTEFQLPTSVPEIYTSPLNITDLRYTKQNHASVTIFLKFIMSTPLRVGIDILFY